MIAGWDDAPVAKISMAMEQKPITLIYPFYCNANFLQRQIWGWLKYPEKLCQYLSAIIVDDGSPEGKAEEIIRNCPKPFPIRLFYIDVDVRWNWLAARNIAMKHAPEGWCLATDMDHVIPVETAEALTWGSHNPNHIYRFGRIEQSGEKIKSHPNSWMMTKKMFWKFGGYDETFSGYYGTDGEARRRWVQTAPVRTLKEVLVRYEHCGDSSTIKYKRKQPEDIMVQKIVAERNKNWHPKVLSFPFHEVNLNA